jgi:carbonic anhydrase
LAADYAVDYALSGADWGELCQTGREQSPVDLSDLTQNHYLSLDLQGYADFAGRVYNLGTTAQVNFDEQNADARMTLVRGDGSVSEWVPLQFHYHAPSEHTIGGRQLDLELHFVHLTPEGGLGAVLGVFFDREEGGNRHNDFIEAQDFGMLSSGEGDWSSSGQIPLDDLIDELEESSFVSYDGSLTTPPCTEGVRWTVSMNVQHISDEQLGRITRAWAGDYDFARGAGNFRLPQPLHGRTLWYHGSGDNLYGDMGAAALGAAATALAALLSF